MAKEVILTNFELLNAMAATKELLKIVSDKLSTKTKWNLVKNMKKMEQSYKVYSECEMDLINQYALHDEKTNEIKLDDKNEIMFTPANKKEFIKKKEELLKMDNTIDILTVPLSELDNPAISGEILYLISFMIDEE